jgi:hypothetical protein
MRRFYEAGYKQNLLNAIMHAIRLRRPPADWAAQAFEKAYLTVTGGKAESWDDVFGRPKRAGEHLRSIEREAGKFEVYNRVQIHASNGAPIDDRLFEQVGLETGLGKATTIRTLYYKAKAVIDRASED